MDQGEGDEEPLDHRYYLSYRGVDPPSIMVGPIGADALVRWI